MGGKEVRQEEERAQQVKGLIVWGQGVGGGQEGIGGCNTVQQQHRGPRQPVGKQLAPVTHSNCTHVLGGGGGIVVMEKKPIINLET